MTVSVTFCDYTFLLIYCHYTWEMTEQSIFEYMCITRAKFVIPYCTLQFTSAYLTRLVDITLALASEVQFVHTADGLMSDYCKIVYIRLYIVNC